MNLQEVQLIIDGIDYLEHKVKVTPDMRDIELLDIHERIDNLHYCLRKAVDRRR